ncbi:hypothetical protein [Lactobacillus sp. ESL0228]|uniref:hypothetical protein n=1 Tax=Lactobacillus sp. ESL0228 TaxID=2069352 RepID=UPI001314ADD6|nr:hypothetical protein [Lactobacillus sp. ESL0228]
MKTTILDELYKDFPFDNDFIDKINIKIIYQKPEIENNEEEVCIVKNPLFSFK